ncbi:peptidase M76 [Halteromyces radiatus]|uniref:peptidase M76 n=1 Tax=Halteromyces radiatus TaxID=101107 RepID=UPI00221FCB56|nr:peptidase M76 [Halteromyces radiatus]KAI8097012.1 peptidase M76 [Halteromyces radiatus]
MRLYEPPFRPTLTEEQCTAKLARILDSSPKVTTLLQAIQTLNRGTLRRGITCRPCSGTNQQDKMGYYDGTYKRVVLCCDNIRSAEELEETLIHELVHAFDASRKGTFTSICHLIACGEVRASALGQCYQVKPEYRRQQCILRDAIQSTQLHCGDQAAKIVEQVYEKCMKDTSPLPP